MPCEGSRSELKLGKNEEEEIPSSGDAEWEPGVRSGWCAQMRGGQLLERGLEATLVLGLYSVSRETITGF